jgi:hypothetical protein
MNVESKRRCWSCGAKILVATARRNLGRCRPCAKKGWYGRLWEIITRTSSVPTPQPSEHVSEIRRILQLPPSATPTADELFEDLERFHLGAGIDHRSEPDEALSELRALPLWTEPEGEAPEPAEELVSWAAEAQRSRGLRLVNIQAGCDGWLLVVLHPQQIPDLLRSAERAGIWKPVVL